MAKSGFSSYSGTQVNAVRGAANIGTDDGLVYLPPGFAVAGISSEIASPTRLQTRQDTQRMSPEVDGFWLQNNSSGADLIGGVGLRIANRHWNAGQWDDSGATAILQYIEDTTDAQDRDSVDDFSWLCAADDDGFAIGSEIPWGWLTMDIDTENSANAATLFEYWDQSGAWALPAATSVKMSELIVSAGKTGTGETTYVWDPAQDWGKSGETYAGSVLASPNSAMPTGMYWARFRIDGADVSAGNITASAIEIGIHSLVENIDDESTASRGPNLNLYSPFCDAVVFINSLYGTGNLSYYVTARARG